MNEHPILFSGEMVKAILEGRKTQTRRVIKLPEKDMVYVPWIHPTLGFHHAFSTGFKGGLNVSCPYGEPGDRLWVRETWQKHNGYIYAADFTREELKKSVIKWRPSIFMPRDASRIMLEIVNVRVERVQDISHNDVLAEGVPECKGYKEDGCDCVILSFEKLWNSINAARGFGWDVNPYVWVVEFKRL